MLDVSQEYVAHEFFIEVSPLIAFLPTPLEVLGCFLAGSKFATAFQKWMALQKNVVYEMRTVSSSGE